MTFALTFEPFSRASNSSSESETVMLAALIQSLHLSSVSSDWRSVGATMSHFERISVIAPRDAMNDVVKPLPVCRDQSAITNRDAEFARRRWKASR